MTDRGPLDANAMRGEAAGVPFVALLRRAAAISRPP
jgi:hypothetical protein